ncbi:MAG TPA: DUF480 domain-containing protein [Solirubrobacteraceae bacterium]|jgi:uncharacterized protein YceH (UPF0502 family)|nr:DUF480 domain-containing protein [Solirubrobacteraceae bacterium]
MDLSAAEIRVLGCLLEKQRTTPDHYPLSLNSLRLACNQSTNRDPVVEYDEGIVRDALHRLERRGYVRLAGASRAAKYRHLLSEALPMSSAEQAIMCVLMLRGPQTPGELKQRGERIHVFAELDELHVTLAALIDRELVSQLARRPGQKEDRYTQQLGGQQDSVSASPAGNGVAGMAPVASSAMQPPMPSAVSTGVPSPPTPAEATVTPAPTLAAPVHGVSPPGLNPQREDDLRERVTRLEQENDLHERVERLEQKEDLRERVARLEAEVAKLRAMLFSRT